MILSRKAVSSRLNSDGFSIMTKCPVPCHLCGFDIRQTLLHVPDVGEPRLPE
jgi:hypothetical protein